VGQKAKGGEAGNEALPPKISLQEYQTSIKPTINGRVNRQGAKCAKGIKEKILLCRIIFNSLWPTGEVAPIFSLLAYLATWRFFPVCAFLVKDKFRDRWRRNKKARFILANKAGRLAI
jgi:hypothetical protein